MLDESQASWPSVIKDELLSRKTFLQILVFSQSILFICFNETYLFFQCFTSLTLWSDLLLLKRLAQGK